MKLAEDASEAPSKANAGLIGPISLSDLSPDLRKVIEPMKNGEISPVIRTPRGYQIFKVETLTASQTTPFEQARESISDRIVTGKRKEEFDKYLAKLRAQAIIEWKNQDVKKAFEEGLAEQAKLPAPAAAVGVLDRGAAPLASADETSSTMPPTILKLPLMPSTVVPPE